MATRTERVVLVLDDNFTSGVAKAAAQTAILDKQIDGLSRNAVRGSSSIDQFSGRLNLMAKAALTLGPALIPIGAVAVPAVAGLATQLGFAGLAAGTAVIAFQGVGDTLEAVNKAALEPTTENLNAAAEAMERLSPAGQALVTQLQSMRPILDGLRDSAAEGLFPGVIEGLQSLEALAPRVEQLLFTIGDTLGGLFSDSASALAGERFADFFDTLQSLARDTLSDLGSAIGSVVHGLTELFEAFAPLQDGFGDFLRDAAAGFDEWASGLSQTEGFRDFLAYVRANGPQVADAAIAIANAGVQIVQAFAPLGGPALEAITVFADALGLIADSPLGPPLAAAAASMAALSLATDAAAGAMTRFGIASATAEGGLLGLSSKAGVAGVVIAGLAFEANRLSGVWDKFQSGDTSGGIEGLGRELVRLLPGAGAAADIAEQLGFDIFPQLGDSADEASDSVEDAGRSFGGVTPRAADLAAANNELGDSFRATAEAALSVFDATTAYRRALAAASEQAKASNAGIRGNTEQALANRDALSQLASAWNELSPAARRGAEAQRDARKSFIDAAEGMGVASGQAERLADRFLNMPPAKVKMDKSNFDSGAADVESRSHALDALNPTLLANINDQASGPMSNIERLANELNGKHSTVTITTIQRTVHQNIGSTGGDTIGNRADGGPIPKDGGPYGDRLRYLLAPGEFVVSNRSGQVDRNLGLLFDINAGRLADGGVAGGDPARPRPSFTEATIIDLLERRLKSLEKTFDAAEKAVDRERQARDAIVEQMNQLSASVQSGLRSDLFGGETNAFFDDFAAGSPGAVNAQLRADIANGQEFTQLIQTLKDKGLDGPALAEIISTGDIERARLYASLSPADLNEFETLFNQRDAVLAATGSAAGDAVFGPALADQTKVLERSEAKLERISERVKEVERAIREEERESREGRKKGAGTAARKHTGGR